MAGPFSGDEAKLVTMARVVAAVGIQGLVKLKTFTEDAEGLAAFDRWVVRTPEGWRELSVTEFAVRPNGTVAKLAGCDDRTAAERLRGAEVAIPRDELGEPDEGELYWIDLVGLEVVDEAGEKLGTLESLFESGPTSVMVVRGERERMIPFVPEYVKSVDREAKRITVDWKADYDT